jgi:hypothetical protein
LPIASGSNPTGSARCINTERALTAVDLLGGRQTMAVHKATRSLHLAQPHAAARRLNPQHSSSQPSLQRPRRNDPQLKAELFEALRHLNRGFGVALSSLDTLQRKDRPHSAGIFPPDFLLSYRDRTEALRAQANRDLLRLLAGREEEEAEQFGHLCGPTPVKAKRKRRV